MTKTSKKKQKAIFKIEKSVFKKLIKANYNSCSTYERGTVFEGIKFEYAKDKLKMISTDGARLLVNEVQCSDGNGECEAVYNGRILGKISFLKNIYVEDSGYIDFLEFTMTPENLQIWDIANNIIYNVRGQCSVSQYPKYEKVFPEVNEKGEFTKIGLNIGFLNELKNMAVDKRLNLVKLWFKNNSPLTPIIAETENKFEDTKSKILIMPIQTRED